MTTHPTPDPGTAATDTISTEDAFLALVLADPQLLEEEFNEIMTDPRLCPPPPKGPSALSSWDQPDRGPGTAHTTSRKGIPAVTRPHGPSAEGWNRQRSPPTT